MVKPRLSLLAALIAITLVVTVALGWAGWRLVDQQRAIDEQRVRERLEINADAVAATIRGKVAEAGEKLSDALASRGPAPPEIDDGVVVGIDNASVSVTPPDGLPFVPFVHESSLSPDPFSSGESAEFAAGQLQVAIHRYRALTTSDDLRIRAGALLRLGRSLRKSHDLTGALITYRELERMGPVRSDGLPAELSGLDGQRLAYQAVGDTDNEQRVATQLLDGVNRGRWLITRGTAAFYRDVLHATGEPESWRLADALTEVWLGADGHLPSRGQRLIDRHGQRVIVMWRSVESRAVLFATDAHTFFRPAALAPLGGRLTDAEGQIIAGDAVAPERPVTRIIGNAEFPWTLQVWAPASPVVASNRALLLTMMVATLAFVWGAAYFIARAIRRESAVARLQSDFVAAVSHEFRSPLTTVRQMAEMLESGRLQTDERRQKYYGMIASEAARLQRLVETLLNFGRMEAGAERYRLVDVDAVRLVSEVVRDIEPQAREAGRQIEVIGADAEMHVLADGHALAVALRNLIDNAIKYSHVDSTVSIHLTKRDDRASMSVVDRGTGIPRAEQRAIFDKFVRGRAAIDANVKGTGVGLSMVQQIVRAHGGEIHVESEVGRGSTFTLLLPLPAEASR